MERKNSDGGLPGHEDTVDDKDEKHMSVCLGRKKGLVAL